MNQARGNRIVSQSGQGAFSHTFLIPRVVNAYGIQLIEIMNAGPDIVLPERVPASPELVALATDLIRKFSECFWFRHPEATVRFTDDVELVIEHLREYGDKKAWDAAAELQRSL